MPQTCSICLHPDKTKINQALVAQTPLRNIAAQYSTSTGALQRHKEHLPRLLAKAKEAKEILQADDLLVQLRALRNKAVSLLMKAEGQGDIRTALQGIREARACLELLAELEGELNRTPQVNILVSPQWVQVRAVLVDALREFPTARAVVAGKLMQLEGGRLDMTDVIASDLALALDPCLVFERLGMDPDPWQARLLRSAAKREIVNCHRQAGKSVAMGVLAAHTAVFVPDSLILLLSPTLRQSQELFRKCLDAYHALEQVEQPDAESALRLEISNGSRIVSLPGKEGTIRGYSGVRLLIVDEASRVADDLYYSARPCSPCQVVGW